jgi:hypothetical protein
MDAESYLYWLKRTELEAAQPKDLLEAVDAVMVALEQELQNPEDQHAQEMLDSLAAIRQELIGGSIPVKAIEEFRVEFDNDPDTYEAPEMVLEQELREIAIGIAPERWSTETFENLANAINTFLDGGEEDAFWDVVDGIESIIDSSYNSYSETHILPKERTLESVVVHKLLLEGMEDWKASLVSIREDEDPDWEWVLQTAEHGNRLLVAVQIFNERVQGALSA